MQNLIVLLLCAACLQAVLATYSSGYGSTKQGSGNNKITGGAKVQGCEGNQVPSAGKGYGGGSSYGTTGKAATQDCNSGSGVGISKGQSGGKGYGGGSGYSTTGKTATQDCNTGNQGVGIGKGQGGAQGYGGGQSSGGGQGCDSKSSGGGSGYGGSKGYGSSKGC